ncbi:asparaginase [Pseudomonas sp. 5P_3.1_Bac2]|uniref:asparaginase n=1 Tax=Pseudomonas sp. 5P_3.1_Bac2 TaxID=2971617 RepID=UPI0021CA9E5D|nr:asparaginase [Pseudomonas sp. 5P_3.1_Bac2]MCU1719223.1 asparaginase [Pseudomonas sp. 5P_3.1_Bac2]
MGCNNLLLLYTGGTIGMQMSAAGLAPAGGFAERVQAEQQRQQLSLPTWQFAELLPPIDSANMNQQHWLAMAAAIRQGVEQGCDGVLLLHGTDTLAYSAAALSFLLLNLPVPVLLTGSMLPAGAPDSDAWSNLFGAMAALKQGQAHGVQLFFNGQLLPGTRVSKLRSEAFDAFQQSARPRHGQRATQIPAELSYQRPRQLVNIAVLPFYPGIQARQVQALLDSGVQALLLECYGSGTGPSDDAQLLAVLQQAHQRGVVLAAISQCGEGQVEFGVYAAGSQLAQCGLLSGAGMTREAALGKLFTLLGAGLKQDEVGHWFALDLCGELAP